MRLLFSLFILFCAQFAIAESEYFDGRTLKQVNLSDVVDRIQPGTIIVFGELHGSEEHHQNQRDLLALMAQKKELPALSVGLEFIDYTQQAFLDDYLNQVITEDLFLEKVKWGGIPFRHYRFQTLLPIYRQGWTYGINLPRSITSKVGRGGLKSLNPDELAMLPPNFVEGGDDYYERFAAAMKGHVPEEAIERYFTAHSLWDDTMAWRSMLAMKNKPNQSLAIMVGDFHAAWGHGLADRLRARGAQDVIVITQVSDKSELIIDPKYGARGDFVFVPKQLNSGHSLIHELNSRLTFRD